MRILMLGDVVGRSGRDAVIERLPRLRADLGLDFVTANGENAAGGFGITAKICEALFAAGADAVTTGNHVWDQREIIDHFQREPRLLRPLNYPASAPGAGFGVFKAPRGKRVLVVNAMGRLFMDPLDDPFAAIDGVLNGRPLGAPPPAGVDAILIDLHAEATSEKAAMGHYLDGRVSVVAGTHTHVPTADTMRLPGGTAFQSDLGMCGDYNSVIGMKKEAPLARFTRKMPTDRLTPAEGDATVCGLFVETDARTGLALHAAPLRLGGNLAPAWPAGALPGRWAPAAE